MDNALLWRCAADPVAKSEKPLMLVLGLIAFLGGMLALIYFTANRY